MTRRSLLLALAGGVACFVLGVAASRMLTPAPPPAVRVVEPKIQIDPDAINLLPDASLRLELPKGFDAGPE